MNRRCGLSRSAAMPAALALLGIAATATVAPAETLRVPADHPTIQAAIVAANDGDEILVARGTYRERINFLGKRIVVRSEEGWGKTTIDAEGLGRVVTFHNGEGPDSVLKGFTITGGAADEGAGIDIFSSSPTIRACKVSWNNATLHGGGIYVAGGAPRIIQSAIQHNTADAGAGMFIVVESTPLIRGTGFFRNNAIGNGGGIYQGLTSHSTVRNCSFLRNTATEGGGGGIWSGGPITIIHGNFQYGSAPVGGHVGVVFADAWIERSFFQEGDADLGGGLFLYYADAVLRDCNFIQNSADQGGHLYVEKGTARAAACYADGGFAVTSGGSIAIVDGAAVTLMNSVIGWTYPPGPAVHNGGGFTAVNCRFQGSTEGAIYADSGNTRIYNSILWGNGPTPLTGSGRIDVRFSDVEHGYAGRGNIDAPPRFTGSGELRYDSPCIDIGSPTLILSDFADLDGDEDTSEPTPIDMNGNPRVSDDPNRWVPCVAGAPGDPEHGMIVPAALGPDGRRCPGSVDIGPYERWVPCRGDADANKVFDLGDLGELLFRFGSCQGEGAYWRRVDMDHDGCINISDLSLFLLVFGQTCA